MGLFSFLGDIVGDVFGGQRSSNKAYNQQKNLNAQQQAYNVENMNRQFDLESQMLDRQFWMQGEQMALQNQYNIDMFNRENVYNSPLAQRQRAMAAGLNPNFSMGADAVAASGQSVSPAGAPSAGGIGLPSTSAGSAPQRPNGSISDMMSVVGAVENVLKMGENVKGKKLENDVLEQQKKELEMKVEVYKQQMPYVAANAAGTAQHSVAEALKAFKECKVIEDSAHADIKAKLAQAGWHDAEAKKALELISPTIENLQAQTQELFSKKFYNEKSIELNTRQIVINEKQLKVNAWLANAQAEKCKSEAEYNRQVIAPLKRMYNSLANLHNTQAKVEDIKYQLGRLDVDAYYWMQEHYPDRYFQIRWKNFSSESRKLEYETCEAYERYRKTHHEADKTKFEQCVQKYEWMLDMIAKGEDVFYRPLEEAANVLDKIPLPGKFFSKGNFGIPEPKRTRRK